MTSSRMACLVRGRPGLRFVELSYFFAASSRNQSMRVCGETIWQQALRSATVSCLPLMARRRRWSSQNGMRLRPVTSVNI